MRQSLAIAVFIFGTVSIAYSAPPGPPPPTQQPPQTAQPPQSTNPYAPFFPPLATLTAAFLGPWFAFKVASRWKIAEERKNKILAGNVAIHVLSLQHTALMNIKTQIVDPSRSDPNRYIVMRPTLPSTSHDLEVDYRDLNFLLNSDRPIILYELRIVQAQFKETLQAFNEWSRIHREEAQPRLEISGLRDGGSYTQGEIEKSLGPRIMAALRGGADNSIAMIDKTIVNMEEISKTLHQALKETFPGEKFLVFEKKAA